MADFFEIDFLDVEAKDSGDAIPLRYEINGVQYVHVVDGGFQDTGDLVVDHIKKYYGAPSIIDHVVVTHSDGDHACGLRKVLEEFRVRNLWILRPWMYADVLINRFSRYNSVENLKKKLKEIYSHLDALEQIAIAKNIPMREPIQGAKIGSFTVLAPSRARYLDLIVESERTPDATKEQQRAPAMRGIFLEGATVHRAAWGVESFPNQESTNENQMSVVQYTELLGKGILLTGDAGRGALEEAMAYAASIGISLSGISYFQVPHHGSRHNVSTKILDGLLGPRLRTPLPEGQHKFWAIISAAKADKDHPRKAVVRAMIHRGGGVVTTESGCKRISLNPPPRTGWCAAEPVAYPEVQERV